MQSIEDENIDLQIDIKQIQEKMSLEKGARMEE